MIEELKSYPEYADSGLPWLGKLPRNWGLVRAKYLFREVDERSETGKEELLSVSHITGVTPRSQKTITMFLAKSNVGHKVCRPDDLVINTLWAWMAALGVSRHHGIVSPAYGVYRRLPGSNLLPRFADAVLRTPLYAAEYLRRSTGVNASRLRLYPEQFLRIPVIAPPADEQAAIVRFLDHANRKIERAIRVKRKLIALLNEQKQAIIHRAVTRGLDPAVKLKPSGIPWLGEVPAHWSLKRFKLLTAINSGQVDPRKPEYRRLVLIAPNHIRTGTGELIKMETAEEQGADSGKYLVSSGQIIYSKIRPNLRKATIAPCDCLCSADMYPISPTTKELLPSYLLLLLLSQPFTKFAVDTSMRVAMPKVNRETLGNCVLWFPCREEQSQILAFLSGELSPFDSAISNAEREIALVREYSITLSANVVAGKLNVREAVKRLPVEVEPMPDDDLFNEEDVLEEADDVVE